MTYLEKIKKLPPLISNFFLSDKPRHELEKSCYMYEMNDDFIMKIAPSIGLLYINELPIKILPSLINKEINIASDICYGIAYEINYRIFSRFPEHFNEAKTLLYQWEKLKTPPIISEDEAWKKVLEVEPWILEEEKEEREAQKEIRNENIKIQSAIEKIVIKNALEKFPDLGEQLVTSNHIKLKNFPEPVRPSINNWLSDYTFSLGFESHSAMGRGTYLFKNENAKGLNSIDREKISFILKAYDENSPVEVNINTKQIVFPKREQANISATFNGGSTSKREVEPPREFHPQTPQRNNFQEIYNARLQNNQPKDIFEDEKTATQNRNTANLNFSSPQKLPYEKQTIQPAQQPEKPIPSPQPLHISSQNLRNSNVPLGNIVNLKDKQ